MALTTVTMRPVASTRTSSAKPTTAYSAAAQSQLAMRPGSAYSYLQFALPRDLPGSVVVDARIQLVSTTKLTGTRELVAQLMSGPLSYATMTWKNAKAVLAGSTPRTGGPTSSPWHEIGVTADFALVADGAKYYGHRLQNSEAGVTRTFFGAKHATYYPRLVLTYARETPAPTGISPRGAVALAKPTFAWATPTDIIKVQARADVAGGNFTAPTWTSPELDSQLGHVATAATSYPGLANGATAAFQFRQLGTLGWSPWSQPVEVTRRDYPALEILLPVPDGSSNDPTPPHAWTLPGQSKFRLTILDATRKVLYTQQVSGDDQDWTPSLTALKIRNRSTLTSVLDVWDDRTDRTASPGDPGYVTRSWSWTIAPTDDTAGVVGFRAVLQVNRPAPVLTWTRPSGEPDEYILERNGDLVARLDGDQHQTSPTSWAYEDWDCPPNADVTYSLHAVVDGKMSKGTAVSTVFAALDGLAIYDPESGAWFNVAGNTAGDQLGMTESSVTYKGPYAQAGVKRIMALGGIEGPVAGVIAQHGDRTVTKQLEDIAVIRANPTRIYRLVWGLINVPVTVSEISSMLAPEATRDHMQHKIAFTLAQVDEFDTGPTGEDPN